MSPIIFNEALFAYDELDGKQLQAGENLRVQFPDGTIEDHVVLITTQHFDYQSGMKLEFSRERAFFNVNTHGIWKWMTAVGLKAERIA